MEDKMARDSVVPGPQGPDPCTEPVVERGLALAVSTLLFIPRHVTLSLQSLAYLSGAVCRLYFRPRHSTYWGYYRRVVGWEAAWQPGGPADTGKAYWDSPTPGANNIGMQGEGVPWVLAEGGPLSCFCNRVPGINAVSCLHDHFQISAPSVLIREHPVYNISGMLLAAALTYCSLLCPA